MTLAQRLKQLRSELGFSQETFGGQGLVSAPGWIKIENGQRQASEKLIETLCRWLVENKHRRPLAVALLRDELLTLKYLGGRSPFLRALAQTRARALPNGAALLAVTEPAKPKRGRPAGVRYAKR